MPLDEIEVIEVDVGGFELQDPDFETANTEKAPDDTIGVVQGEHALATSVNRSNMTLADVLMRHCLESRSFPCGNDVLFDMQFYKLLNANICDVIDRIRSYDWISVCEAALVTAIAYDFTLSADGCGVRRNTLMTLIRTSKNILSEKHSTWSSDNGRCTVRMAGISDSETCAKSEVGVNVESLISSIINTTDVTDKLPFAQIDSQFISMLINSEKPYNLSDDSQDSLEERVDTNDVCDDSDTVYVIAMDIDSTSRILCVCKRQSQADEYVQIVNKALSCLPCSVRAYCEQTVVY